MREKEFVMGVGALSFYGATKFWGDHCCATAALDEIRAAPCARVSGLGSLLAASTDDESGRGKLVVLRGWAVCKPVLVVQPDEAASPLFPSDVPSGFAVPSGFEDFFNALLIDSLFRNVQPSSSRSHTDQWLHVERGILKDKGCRLSVELVPFALVDGDQRVYISEDKSRPLPLKLVHRHMHYEQFPSYPSVSTLEDYKYLVAMCNRERHVTIEKEITALGICRNQDGSLQIESCRRLPYFVTDLTKDEIEAGLSRSAENSYWATIMVGALSITFLGFGLLRFGGGRG